MSRLRLPTRGDLTLIFSSLAVAFLIWLIAKQGDTNEATRTVSIRVASPDPICEITLEPTQTQVDLQYPVSLGSLVTNDSFVVEVDGSKARQFAGVRTQSRAHPITIHDLTPNENTPDRVKSDVRHLAIVGARSVTMLSRFHSCPIDIHVRWTGAPAAGYELASDITVDEGAADELQLVSSPDRLEALRRGRERVTVETRPINLSAPDLRSHAYAELDLPEDCHLARVEGRGLLDPREWRVLVNVPIVEETVERRVANVPIELRPFSDDVALEYSPRATDVTVRGARSLVDRLNASSFLATYLASLNETPGFQGKIAISVQFEEDVPEEVREGVTIVSLDPDSVQMTVSAIETGEPGASSGTTP